MHSNGIEIEETNHRPRDFQKTNNRPPPAIIKRGSAQLEISSPKKQFERMHEIPMSPKEFSQYKPR